ncbi:STAS domain-containing protein [Actinoplanes sp. CA-030573]|uniref:STAS domain-containing protein n=1 Tax=Actinoplanes sp. CA-030573 TaxID=3239898 RepID=UPI003D905FA7
MTENEHHHRIVVHRSLRDQTRLVLIGEFDMAAWHVLQEAIHAAVATDSGRQFVVDMAEVTFIDCGTVNILLLERDQAAATGSALSIVNPSDQVRQVLALTGTQSHLLAPATRSRLLLATDGPAFVLRALREPADPSSPGRNGRGGHYRPVTDFLVEDASASMIDLQGRAAGQTVGARLLDLYPSILSTGVFDAYVNVLETAKPYESARQGYHETVDGVLLRGSIPLRARAVDPDRLVVIWQNDNDPEPA